jgi:hypothetical protein
VISFQFLPTGAGAKMDEPGEGHIARSADQVADRWFRSFEWTCSLIPIDGL